MPTSQSYRDLFRTPSTIDKLNFLQLLLDSKDLISDLALALINIVRAELEQPHKQSASAYRRYAAVTDSLCKQMPDVYARVVRAWQQRRRGIPSAEELQKHVEARET